jgi:hypothetical protein
MSRYSEMAADTYLKYRGEGEGVIAKGSWRGAQQEGKEEQQREVHKGNTAP